MDFIGRLPSKSGPGKLFNKKNVGEKKPTFWNRSLKIKRGPLDKSSKMPSIISIDNVGGHNLKLINYLINL